jgi:pyridoxal 5'-phosphate synthase pdxT subunit
VNDRPVIGVLALQGAFAAHIERLAEIGIVNREIRRPEHLQGIDGIVLPGGESTAISNLLKSSGLFESLGERLRAGLPVFGTCAGMILLAEEIIDGRDDQISFGTLPMSVRRNGYGRQIDSFECDLSVSGIHPEFHAVFIRAPKIDRFDSSIEVLASHDGVPVLVRKGGALAASFHPELSPDTRIHEHFVEMIEMSLQSSNTR